MYNVLCIPPLNELCWLVCINCLTNIVCCIIFVNMHISAFGCQTCFVPINLYQSINQLMINILLRDRWCPVLSCCVCIISHWWGQFEIQWKSLGHAFYVNNCSVQERLTRESVYLCDCTKRGFPVRATWTRRKYLTYFGLWLYDTAFNVLLLYARLCMRTAGWHTLRVCARCGVCDSTKLL